MTKARTRGAAIAALLAALVGLLGVVVAPAAEASPARINGTGSTYVALAMQQWVAEGQASGLPVNYTPSGSPQGLSQYADSAVDFAGTEAEYSALGFGDGVGRGFQYVPDVAGAVAIMYNVKDKAGRKVDYLHLSRETVARIFIGDIIKWSDPAIKNAFQMYVTDVLANTYGGNKTAVATNFGNAGDPLFASPPGCAFLHQASFITTFSQFKSHAAGTDYNFFPFPDIDPKYAGAVEGAGDLFGMFHDTAAAKSLMKYLVTAEAQDIWVKIGGALSANKNAKSYPDDISKRSAEVLANAKTFAFDASDSMPTAMNDAFWKGMVALTNGSKSVDAVLADLDAAQKDAYAS